MQPISRRTFFIRTATLAGAAAMAPVLSGCSKESWGSGLSNQESDILKAVTQTVFPQGRSPASGAMELDLSTLIANFMEAETLPNRRLFRGALWVVELSAIPSFRKRFRSLNDLEREQHFVALQSSQYATSRTAVQGLIKATCFVAYAQPETWTPIGYEGPWVKAAVTP